MLMMLCYYNPQLLKYEWAIEMVQQQGTSVSLDRFTALIALFNNNTEKADFSSQGFKLLWEKEKELEVQILEVLIK